MTNTAQTAPHSTRQASPAPPSPPKEPVNNSNDVTYGTGNGNTGTQTRLAPVDTDAGSLKGDITDGSPENIGGKEYKQPTAEDSVDEEGVANV